MQFLNIISIYKTWEVSKFDKSKDFKELHPSKKEVILETNDVLRFDKLTDTKFLQFRNIPFIEVTREVSKSVKSASIILSKALNILSKLFFFSSYSNITSLISRVVEFTYPISSIYERFPLMYTLLGIYAALTTLIFEPPETFNLIVRPVIKFLFFLGHFSVNIGFIKRNKKKIFKKKKKVLFINENFIIILLFLEFFRII